MACQTGSISCNWILLQNFECEFLPSLKAKGCLSIFQVYVCGSFLPIYSTLQPKLCKLSLIFCLIFFKCNIVHHVLPISSHVMATCNLYFSSSQTDAAVCNNIDFPASVQELLRFHLKQNTQLILNAQGNIIQTFTVVLPISLFRVTL